MMPKGCSIKHKAYIKTKRKELRDTKISKSEERRQLHKKALIENEICEERDKISNSPRFSEWV